MKTLTFTMAIIVITLLALPMTITNEQAVFKDVTAIKHVSGTEIQSGIYDLTSPPLVRTGQEIANANMMKAPDQQSRTEIGIKHQISATMVGSSPPPVVMDSGKIGLSRSFEVIVDKGLGVVDGGQQFSSKPMVDFRC